MSSIGWTCVSGSVQICSPTLFSSPCRSCMPFERAELAFPCSRNESGSCPFQSLFLPSNNPLCCWALIWLRSFSAGFNTEAGVCRTGKTVKGILGTPTVTFLLNSDNKRTWKDKSAVKDRIKSDNWGGYAGKRNRNRMEIFITECEWQERWAGVELGEFCLIFYS